MIQLGPRAKVYVSINPVDFRSGFSRLSQMVKKVMDRDPYSGHIYVFRNRAATAIKMICFDGRACWTLHAKFAQGRLSWWPQVEEITAVQLMGLLSQSSKVEVSPAYRDVS